MASEEETKSVVASGAKSSDQMPQGRGSYWNSQGSATNRLPDGSSERKMMPMARGLLDYFPDALAAVAAVSFDGNQKHNPGEEIHWARSKSTDHADCIARHLVDRGGFDGKHRHSAMLAWRALALLQEEIEQFEAKPISRGSRP